MDPPLGRISWPPDLADSIGDRLRRRSPRRSDPSLPLAAVLVPLAEGEDGDFRLVLTRRAKRLRRQPGDIAFPGGLAEGGETAVETALRETCEEIGLPPEQARVLGTMDERRTIHGFRLAPVVGALEGRPRLRAGPEVEEIFEVPLAALLAPGAEIAEVRRTPKSAAFPGFPEGMRGVGYRYRYLDYDIWGLTARIIRDFLDLL